MSGFQGNQFTPGTKAYTRANQLYATSSYGKERDMNPGEILQPTSVEDIQNVVIAATKAKKPIAIRTGGHQYSGASCTGSNGIQLDLQPTFRRPKLDLQLIRDDKTGKVFIRTSVSWTLSEVFDFLLDNGIFMPTGQCITVCLGGHVQTGGYGMLGRSFGLLADWVREIEVVNHNAELVKVTKESDPDLFFGLLGGSPGNMGVVTHYTIEVQDDQKHQGSKGLWVAFHYRKDTLEALLDILVRKAEDPNFPRGYDFNVNIVSRQFNLLDLFPGSEAELKRKLPNFIHDGKEHIADLLKFKFALIVVYAQWVNLGEEPYSPALFDEIQNVPHDFKFDKQTGADTPMSAISSMWLFKSPREFPYPYVKRTNATDSTTLSKTGWSKWFAGRIEQIIGDKHNGLLISSQLQVFGGNQSFFRNSAGNGTAHSWRNSSIVGTWDLFYDDTDEGTRKAAEQWQAENDKGAVEHFSKEERRLLWGSYGDWTMKNVWQHYYDAATYKRLQGIRKKFDPQGIFTANPFCVESA